MPNLECEYCHMVAGEVKMTFDNDENKEVPMCEDCAHMFGPYSNNDDDDKEQIEPMDDCECEDCEALRAKHFVPLR